MGTVNEFAQWRYFLRRLIYVWATCVVWSLSSGFEPVQPTSSPEYQVKAVFLFNFTQFVEWPSAAFAAPDAPLVIGILGKDPFGAYLDETVRGEKIRGHPLTVERYSNADEVKTCHILFINITETNQLRSVLENLKDRHVLTVGDGSTFARRGGVIRLYTENNKTRIRINLEAAKAADLTISSKLLRLAEIVSSENN